MSELIDLMWQEIADYKIDQHANVYLQCKTEIVLPFRKGSIKNCPVCDRYYAMEYEPKKNGFYKFKRVLVAKRG